MCHRHLTRSQIYLASTQVYNSQHYWRLLTPPSASVLDLDGRALRCGMCCAFEKPYGVFLRYKPRITGNHDKYYLISS